MLIRAFVLGFCALSSVNAQFFSDFGTWRNWRTPSNYWPPDLRASASEQISERDREPLSPDYKDPIARPSDEKPVVQLKPTTATSTSTSTSTSTTTTGRPSPFGPTGVIDVDATGPGGLFPTGIGFRPTFPDVGNFGFSSRPGSLFGLGGFFGSVPEFKPWWKGPNVCIEREESTDNDPETEDTKNETEIPNPFATAISLSNCHQTPTKYECITKINNHGVFKTFTVRYKCCYGHKRSENEAGCTKQVDLKPLMETVGEVGGSEFKEMIRSAGLGEKMDGNWTVFAPTDLALNDFSDKMVQLNSVEAMRRRRNLNAVTSKELVLNHIVPGFVEIAELGNEEMIFSENNNSSIRINVYPTHQDTRLVTVNCARVSKPDNLAKNGIVHVIDGVIAPATQSIQDLVSESAKLTSLKQVFKNVDIEKLLKKDGHYTLFAPTDEAFDRLSDGIKQKLLRGDACAPSILKHLIVEHTVCSSAIIGNATTHNIEGNVLNLERTNDDQLIFEGKSKIIKHDIMASNGVIHLIDTVIIPESAQHINQALNAQNFTKFQALIQEAEMADELDAMINATVFAPSDEAFESEEGKKIMEQVKGDKQKLRELIMYHTAKGEMESALMNNDDMLPSNFNELPLRLNLYSTLPVFTQIINRATVNCARITGFDEKSCGSVIHEVNKILVPPKNNILEVINGIEKYSTLSKIIQGTEVEKILKDSNQSLTLLAPTDESFASLAEADLKTLMDDKAKADQVLKNHILTEVLCCSGVGPQTWGFNNLVPALSNQQHQVGRTGKHQIRIGRATVTSCDNMATNGVVHTINRVLVPQRQTLPSFGMFIFDI